MGFSGAGGGEEGGAGGGGFESPGFGVESSGARVGDAAGGVAGGSLGGEADGRVEPAGGGARTPAPASVRALSNERAASYAHAVTPAPAATDCHGIPPPGEPPTEEPAASAPNPRRNAPAPRTTRAKTPRVAREDAARNIGGTPDADAKVADERGGVTAKC